jgi:hypothetical protein
MLTSDIEFAQVTSIASPDRQLVIRLDPEESAWWLAEVSTPEDPILRPDTGEPYVTTLGKGRALSAAGTTLEIAGLSDRTLAFDAQGGLVDFTATPSITLAAGDDWIRLDIAATTGTVSETAGP